MVLVAKWVLVVKFVLILVELNAIVVVNSRSKFVLNFV